MNHRIPRALFVPAVSLVLLAGGCKREQHSDPSPEVARLTAELEATKQKLAAAEKSVAVKGDQLAVAPAAAEVAKGQSPDNTKIVAKKDDEIHALQVELFNLKKSDGVAFGEIRTVQAQGLITTALGRYQQFVVDFPTSPLVSNAKQAISELSVDVTRRNDEVDPGRREREAKQHFADGILTIDEIVPVVKKKTVADVVKMFGPPNKSFRNGAEIGYADKAINNSTGEKGMLIIRFEEGVVATVRIDYAGREVRP